METEKTKIFYATNDNCHHYHSNTYNKYMTIIFLKNFLSHCPIIPFMPGMQKQITVNCLSCIRLLQNQWQIPFMSVKQQCLRTEYNIKKY